MTAAGDRRTGGNDYDAYVGWFTRGQEFDGLADKLAERADREPSATSQSEGDDAGPSITQMT